MFTGNNISVAINYAIICK